MDAGLLAIITAVVGVATIIARVFEKLVDHAVEDRRLKKIPTMPVHLVRSGGHTADLAVQQVTIRELRDDVEKLQHLTDHIDRQVTHLSSRQEQHSVDLKDMKSALDKVRTVLESDVASTRAIYDLLKSGR